MHMSAADLGGGIFKMLVFNVLVLVAVLYPSRKDRRLYQNGLPTLARITKMYHSFATGPLLLNAHICTVHFEYEDANGEVYRNSMVLRDSSVTELDIGDLVPILYNPEKPKDAAIYGYGEYLIV